MSDPTTDPYWNNVSLLLQFDGTNGSTTFTDSSGLNQTVTPNGGASISTAQSKFGASGYFDGVDNYLSVPHSTALNLSSGDFTIELWLYANSFADKQVIFDKDGINNVSHSSYYLVISSTGNLRAFLGNGNGVNPSTT